MTTRSYESEVCEQLFVKFQETARANADAIIWGVSYYGKRCLLICHALIKGGFSDLIVAKQSITELEDIAAHYTAHLDREAAMKAFRSQNPNTHY